jgi:glutaredoxin-like YruB-family protein
VTKVEKKVRVYTTPSCPYCVLVKEFLREHNIDFEEVDVSQDRKAAMEMVTKSGQMGVPVIEVDNEIIIGFNVEKLKQVLNIK